jgi:hypothetical protein
VVLVENVEGFVQGRQSALPVLEAGFARGSIQDRMSSLECC